MQLTAAESTERLDKPSQSNGTDGEQPVQLTGTLLQPAVSVSLTQLHRMRVLDCLLSARLMHGDGDTSDDRFRSGLLSIEQSRSLVPLLHSDPMVCCPKCLERTASMSAHPMPPPQGSWVPTTSPGAIIT